MPLGKETCDPLRVEYELLVVVLKERGTGNLAIFDPRSEQSLGVKDQRRLPTVYTDLRTAELEAALRTMLYEYEQRTNYSDAGREVVARIREQIDRRNGNVPTERLLSGPGWPAGR